jgi:hypothetical protein
MISTDILACCKVCSQRRKRKCKGSEPGRGLQNCLNLYPEGHPMRIGY